MLCVTSILPLQKEVIDMCPPAMLKPCTQLTHTHTYRACGEQRPLFELNAPCEECVCVRALYGGGGGIESSKTN